MLERVLKRIENENQQEELWIVGPATGKILHTLVRVLEPETALEIGTSVGYSALWIASALEKNQKGTLWTIESHAQRFERAKSNIEAAGLLHRVVQIKGHAPEVFLQNGAIPEAINFAFFDATKQEHQAYFDAVFPFMQSGGMIAVDNVFSHRQGQMERFIQSLHRHPALQVAEIPVGDGLLIARIL